MKLNPMLTSTPQLTSDIPREDRMTAVMYVQPDGTALYAVSPKPPTPEAVARAQFVDKTYVWKGVAPKAQLP
jgi:hypothetical protein